jgi:heat shock protein HslJ
MQPAIPVFAFALLHAAPGLADGATPDLSGAQWTVTAISGVDALGPAPTLSFDGKGRFSAFAGCNRIMGRYSHCGEVLNFGPISATKMLCDAAQMEVERAFFHALEKTTRLSVEKNALAFVAANTPVLHAER